MHLSKTKSEVIKSGELYSELVCFALLEVEQHPQLQNDTVNPLRTMLVLVPQGLGLTQKIKKYFCTGCHKSAVRGCKPKFLKKKKHRGIHNQMLGKVQKLSYGNTSLAISMLKHLATSFKSNKGLGLVFRVFRNIEKFPLLFCRPKRSNTTHFEN